MLPRPLVFFVLPAPFTCFDSRTHDNLLSICEHVRFYGFKTERRDIKDRETAPYGAQYGESRGPYIRHNTMLKVSAEKRFAMERAKRLGVVGKMKGMRGTIGLPSFLSLALPGHLPVNHRTSLPQTVSGRHFTKGYIWKGAWILNPPTVRVVFGGPVMLQNFSGLLADSSPVRPRNSTRGAHRCAPGFDHNNNIYTRYKRTDSDCSRGLTN